MIPTVVAPLPALREGRQSYALAGWGSSGLISNQADMILSRLAIHSRDSYFILKQLVGHQFESGTDCKVSGVGLFLDDIWLDDVAD